MLTRCRDCNFNAVRVWGGGYYPDDWFFDICDELDLVVFMDLMFACAMIPGDDEFVENISIEVEQNLKRIRHHACMAVISGNNEVEDSIFCGYVYCHSNLSKTKRKATGRLYTDI